jgi:hypothetical protein
MQISNIDELLNGAKSATQPETPENQYQDEPEEIEKKEAPKSPYEPESDDSELDDEPKTDNSSSDESDDDTEDNKQNEVDDYGNEKPKKRMYSEEEHKELLNKAIRERLERFQRNNPQAQQPTQQQIQQAADKGFNYDEKSDQNWQQQLEAFVENTVGRMATKQQEALRQQQEQELQADFEDRFGKGMQKFNDFREVITNLSNPITDAMTISLRALDDPAAFIYAAAKRHPQDLERISKMRDPYAQMTEMGKLEERMRRNKPTTKAPRPLSRIADDTAMPEKKKSKEPTIEDLIAKSDAKRLANLRQRQRR